MTIKQNASKDFLALAPADKAAFGPCVVSGLVAHASVTPPLFPNLPYNTNTLTATNTALQDAISVAMSGDHNLIDLRNTAEKAWDLEFGKTADYVSIAANGEPSTITAAGFTPTKSTRDKKSKPDNARIKTVTPGAGSASIEVDAQPEADAFLYVLAPADATVAFGADGSATITIGDKKVYVKCDTHRSVVMGGLSDDAKLQIAVQPVNTAGAGGAATGATVRPQ